MNKWHFKFGVFCLSIPALVGFIIFYVWSYGSIVRYSFVSGVFDESFVFFDNFITVLNNDYYQLAFRNTFIFTVTGTLLLITISLVLSLGLTRLSNRLKFLHGAFISPMVLPTAGIIFAWQMFFSNDVYFPLMREGSASSFFQILPIYLLFIWKNTGINTILLTAAFSQVPKETIEAASLDGAGGFRMFRSITLPLISPSLFFVFVLSFISSLRNFRESYLFFNTNYPPDSVYTVQYYMNNHFYKLNYQYLSAGIIVFTLIIAIIILVAYRIDNKTIKNVF